jgi:hypothetical protein
LYLRKQRFFCSLFGFPHVVAAKAWHGRSVYLKQFEVLSLQLERLAAIQTMVVTDLMTSMKQKLNCSSAEVRALFADVTPRLNDLQCLNDIFVS